MKDSQTKSSSRAAVSLLVAAYRIRFVEQAASGERVIRHFADPVRSLAAVREVPSGDQQASDSNELHVLCLSTVESPDGDSLRRALMVADAPATCDATASPAQPLEVKVATSTGKLFWKPGRAVIEGSVPPDDGLLAALAQFAHDEWHLRQLETALQRIEQSAPADVPRAYLPKPSDRTAFARIIALSQELALLRLRAARLEPGAYLPPRDLALDNRRCIARLIARADMEDRLEALSARIEACEDLYEAAVDRMTEQKGLRLERGIILLLSIETVLILIELGMSIFRPR